MTSTSTESYRFLRVLFWESVQNVPLITGFLLGLRLWQQGNLWIAVGCIISGGVAGSLAIWVTESKIVEGHREPPQVVLVNILVFSLSMFALAVYLSTDWSRWWTDLFLGSMTGAVVGAAQDLAAGSPVGWGHCAALAASFALGLAGVRMLVSTLPVVVVVLLLTVAVTIAICLVDYADIFYESTGL
jgi:hypothetical protein